jgi:hypothetical protein
LPGVSAFAVKSGSGGGFIPLALESAPATSSPKETLPKPRHVKKLQAIKVVSHAIRQQGVAKRLWLD